MDIAVTIVMMIPVILAVALIVNVVRKNITERQPGDPVDITGAIPAVIVLMVAVLIIGSMAYSVTDLEDYDEDTNTLTIKASVEEADEYPWDSYAADVKSLILNDDVGSIPDGAFSTMTALEYLSISDSVESITSSAFGVTLKDYLDQTITEPEAGEYVGAGNGTLYYCDPSIYTYSSDKKTITGLASGASSAVNLVFPSEHDGTTVTGIRANAFESNATIAKAMPLPDCGITSIGNAAFRQCTSLTGMSMASVTSIGNTAFSGCTSMTTAEFDSVTSIGSGAFVSAAMTSIDFPELASLGWGAFRTNTALASASLPKLTTLASSMFDGCTALAEIDLSKITSIEGSCFRNTALIEIDLSSIVSLGSSSFTGVTTVTSVTFGSGLDSLDSTALPWTFYDSDGTTQLNKTVANLAGYTFQGTASALVKVIEGAKSLTTEQTLKVQELTKAASLTLELAETEISSVEEKELASA